MVPPPKKKSTFFMGKGGFRCFGNLDFVLEGEEFDYKGRIEIKNSLVFETKHLKRKS